MTVKPNDFVASMDGYAYAKDQHHHSIQSWHNADSILGFIYLEI